MHTDDAEGALKWIDRMLGQIVDLPESNRRNDIESILLSEAATLRRWLEDAEGPVATAMRMIKLANRRIYQLQLEGNEKPWLKQDNQKTN